MLEEKEEEGVLEKLPVSNHLIKITVGNEQQLRSNEIDTAGLRQSQILRTLFNVVVSSKRQSDCSGAVFNLASDAVSNTKRIHMLDGVHLGLSFDSDQCILNAKDYNDRYSESKGPRLAERVILHLKFTFDVMLLVEKLPVDANICRTILQFFLEREALERVIMTHKNDYSDRILAAFKAYIHSNNVRQKYKESTIQKALKQIQDSLFTQALLPYMRELCTIEEIGGTFVQNLQKLPYLPGVHRDFTQRHSGQRKRCGSQRRIPHSSSEQYPSTKEPYAKPHHERSHKLAQSKAGALVKIIKTCFIGIHYCGFTWLDFKNLQLIFDYNTITALAITESKYPDACVELEKLDITIHELLTRFINYMFYSPIGIHINGTKMLIDISVEGDLNTKQISQYVGQFVHDLKGCCPVVQRERLLADIEAIKEPDLSFHSCDVDKMISKIQLLKEEAGTYLINGDDEVSADREKFLETYDHMQRVIHELLKNIYEYICPSPRLESDFLELKKQVDSNTKLCPLEEIYQSMLEIVRQCEAVNLELEVQSEHALRMLKEGYEQMASLLDQFKVHAHKEQDDQKAREEQCKEALLRCYKAKRVRLTFHPSERTMTACPSSMHFSRAHRKKCRSRSVVQAETLTVSTPIDLALVKEAFWLETLLLNDLQTTNERPEVKHLCYLFNLLKVARLFTNNHLAHQFCTQILYGGWQVTLKDIEQEPPSIPRGVDFKRKDEIYFNNIFHQRLQQIFDVVPSFTVDTCIQRIEGFLDNICTILGTTTCRPECLSECVLKMPQMEAIFMAMIYIDVQREHLFGIAKDKTLDENERAETMINALMKDDLLKNFLLLSHRVRTVFSHERRDDRTIEPVWLHEVIGQSLHAQQILARFREKTVLDVATETTCHNTCMFR